MESLASQYSFSPAETAMLAWPIAGVSYLTTGLRPPSLLGQAGTAL